MTVHDVVRAPVCRVDAAHGSCVAGARPASVQLQERTVWGQRMLYREAGSKENPTVLLLHGMAATAWNITALLHSLAPTFHVIAPDHIGAGLHPAPTPATAEQAIASMGAHVDALMRQLDLVSVGVVAQDIAACVTQQILAAGRPNGAVWAVAVEGLPAGQGTRSGGLGNRVPAERSAFDRAVHPLLAAHNCAFTLAASTFRRAGIPTACFQAQERVPDGWEPNDARPRPRLGRARALTGYVDEHHRAAQLTYTIDPDGAPADHELCRLGRWLTRFLAGHAPTRRP